MNPLLPSISAVPVVESANDDSKPVNKNCPKGLTVGAKKLLESKGYLVTQDEFCDVHLGFPIDSPKVLSQVPDTSDKVAREAIKGISTLGVISKTKAQAIQAVVSTYYGRD